MNLPHLHRRTNKEAPEDTFRPGVERTETGDRETIDLSDEFERQFFGDLMLFTTETLATSADVYRPFTQDRVVPIMERKERELLALYHQKHDAILAKSRQLNAIVFDAGHWWLDDPGLTSALGRVHAFIDNINDNFGGQSSAWQKIQSAEHRAERKKQILEALMNYRTERDAWERLLQDRS